MDMSTMHECNLQYNRHRKDLVKSNFKVNEDDTDFDLTHEQVVKILKIFQYKMQLMEKKASEENNVLEQRLLGKEENSKLVFKQSVDEVNTFIN